MKDSVGCFVMNAGKTEGCCHSIDHKAQSKGSLIMDICHARGFDLFYFLLYFFVSEPLLLLTLFSKPEYFLHVPRVASMIIT